MIGRQPLRIGVLGTARVVAYGLLLPARQTPGVEVVAVGSRSLETAQSFASRHGMRARRILRCVMQAVDVDAVISRCDVVARQWVRRSLTAGKPCYAKSPCVEMRSRRRTLLAAHAARRSCSKSHIRTSSGWSATQIVMSVSLANCSASNRVPVTQIRWPPATFDCSSRWRGRTRSRLLRGQLPASRGRTGAAGDRRPAPHGLGAC